MPAATLRDVMRVMDSMTGVSCWNTTVRDPRPIDGLKKSHRYIHRHASSGGTGADSLLNQRDAVCVQAGGLDAVDC